MPYRDPYRNTQVDNPYKSLGSGYYQDLRTGQVKRRAPYGYRDVDNATEDLYETRFARQNEFNRNLERYDQEARKYSDEAMRTFGQAAELGASRQLGGVMSNVNQYIQRAGIGGSGIAAALQNQTQGALAAETQQAQQAFNARLLTAMHAERDSFLKGEFDFIKRLQTMDYGFELQKKIMQFQADLQNDLTFRDAFMGVLGLGGQVVGSFINPFGAAAGALTSTAGGGTFPGGPAGYEDPNYGGA